MRCVYVYIFYNLHIFTVDIVNIHIFTYLQYNHICIFTIHTVKYYSPKAEHELLPFATTQMDLKVIC